LQSGSVEVNENKILIKHPIWVIGGEMLVSKAKMEALRIVGFYKDYNADVFRPAKMYSEAEAKIFTELLNRRLITFNRKRTSLHITSKGLDVLNKAGLGEGIGKYKLSENRLMARRHQNAKIAFFLNEIDVDVFLTDIPQRVTGSGFLSASKTRDKSGSNIIGKSKFNGLLYTKSQTYVIYNLTNMNSAVLPLPEENIFMRESIKAHNPVTVLYMCNCGLEQMLNNLLFSTPDYKKISCGYYDAIQEFSVPVCLVPINSLGLVQMQIMLTQDYKRKIAKDIFRQHFRQSKARWADGINSDVNKYLVVFFDFDIKRLQEALSVEKENLYVLVLKEQKAAVKLLLNSLNMSKVKVGTISKNEAFRILNIQSPQDKNLMQFLTADGIGIDVGEELIK